MFCRQCGNQIAEGAKFCNQCGCKVEVDVSVQPVNVPINNQQEIKETIQVNEQSQAVTMPTETVVNKVENVQVAPVAVKKKSKAWIVWLLVVILILGLGATATVLFFKYMEYVEESDEDEDSEQDEDEEEDDEDATKTVSKKQKDRDIACINSVMDAIVVISYDPAIDWKSNAIVYVRFTDEGAVYGCNNQEVIDTLETIVPCGDAKVSAWTNGMEIWAKKEPNGNVSFATSMDLNEIAKVSEGMSRRFTLEVTEPVISE